jgi:hypothetical protein
MKTIRLQAYDIVVEVRYPIQHDGKQHAAGHITSDLHDPGESRETKAMLDAIESLVLAHACAGLDIESPAYLQGLETAVEAVFNQT